MRKNQHNWYAVLTDYKNDLRGDVIDYSLPGTWRNDSKVWNETPYI